MITANDPFRSAPRISRDEFARVLQHLAAPGVVAERDPRAYWDVIVATGVDPLFILAMFQHESTMGKYGMARTTHSWGNTRRPSFGVPDLGTDNNFSVYRDWLDGCKSTAARLVAPDWVYSGQSRNAQTGETFGPRAAIRELFIHPSEQVWAPVHDNNDPDNYLNTVIRDMNGWADGGEPPAPFAPPAGWTPPPVRIAYVPKGRANRPGTTITPRKNIFHDTGNPNLGADAEAHRAYVHGGGGKESTSYQYVVDDHEIVALIPEGEKAYHALDPCNSESNGIELCINSDGDWNLTLWNGAWLGAQLEERGVTDHRQHHDCTGKNCPARLRDSGTWDDFLARIAYFRNVPPPAPPPDKRTFPETGASIVWGFKGYWERLEQAELAYLALGYPLADETPQTGLQGVTAAQRFERGWLVYEPGNAAPWDIHHATIEQIKILEGAP